MDDEKKKRDEEIALHRYGLISELVRLPRGEKGLYAKLRAIAEAEHQIPGSTRTRIKAETLRDWLKRYRKGGFDALKPRPRSDAGQSRALPRDVADLLVSLKEKTPELTVPLVIQKARESEKVPKELVLAHATVHRLLSRHGLMQKRPGEPQDKDRRRFTYPCAGDLWMSDVMHGPAVVVSGKEKRKTYLIAFIDDATRVVPYAAFALSENTAAFLPVFKQALMRRGLPKRLYVDNGAAYRSQHLSLVCAKLGITLIHARAYHPEAKGKQERWFRTVRMQLLPTLTPEDTRSLDALNRRLWAYVEGEYHQAPHSSLDGQTPLDAWAAKGSDVRYPGPELDLEDLFLFEQKRKVQKDRTVSLDGRVYEVDASLVGTVVVLRYDPARTGGVIQVWAGGRKVQDARLVDAYANCHVKRERPSRTLVPIAQEPPSQAPVQVPRSTLRLSDAPEGGGEEEER